MLTCSARGANTGPKATTTARAYQMGDSALPSIRQLLQNDNGIRAGANAGPAGYLHPETRELAAAVGGLGVDLVLHPLAGPGAHPGEAVARCRAVYSHQHENPSCQFPKKMASHYKSIPVVQDVHFFGFHGGFRRPETQPQAGICSMILKIKK